MSSDHFNIAVSLYFFMALLAAGTILPAAPAAAEPSRTVYTRQPDALAPAGAAGLLRQAAREKGKVRVIVGLGLKLQSETVLGAPEAEKQRQGLREVQDRVAARALGGAAAPGVERFEYIPYVSLYVTPDALERLLRDPEVVSVQHDVPVPPLLKQSIPLIHAKELFAKDNEGIGHAVAVLDTGVSAQHPMLTGKVVSEACYSSNVEEQDATSVCPGKAESLVGEGSAKFCALGVSGCDHGAHVASIAVGNSDRLDGVARGADLIAIQVFTKFDECGASATPCVKSFETDQVKGLERVFKLRDKFDIDAANMSLGGGSSSGACDGDHPALKTAIDNLREAGIATVIASGNDGTINAIAHPACISTAIAVGNTNDVDQLAESSNHSPFIKLLAPGTNIEAAVPTKRYQELTGTSMAAPHVAGAFALMRDAKPTASIDNILAALTCSGKTVHQRQLAGKPNIEIEPQRPRIDLLGAYNWLRSPPNNKRNWLFDNDSDETDWSPLLGRWTTVGGSYAQQPLATGWVGSYVANCSGSYRAEAVMTRIDPEPQATGFFANAGVMFNATINQANKTVSGYWVAYNKCRTSADGACTNLDEDKPGQAVFWKMNNVDLDGGGFGFELQCQKKAKVNVNKGNVVKVVSNGSSHSYFLNGKLVCQVDDASYLTGPIMAASFIRETAGHSFRLNDLLTQSTDSGPATPSPLVMDPAASAPKALPAGMTPAGSFAPARSAAR